MGSIPGCHGHGQCLTPPPNYLREPIFEAFSKFSLLILKRISFARKVGMNLQLLIHIQMKNGLQNADSIMSI